MTCPEHDSNILMGVLRFNHMTPVLQELYWLSVAFWTQFEVLVITYEALLGPGYLFYEIPHEFCDLLEKAFSIIAPWLWKTLSIYVSF